MESTININSNIEFNYSETEGQIHNLDTFIALANAEIVGDHNGLVGHILASGKIISEDCLSVETILDNHMVLKMIEIEKGSIEIVWFAD